VQKILALLLAGIMMVACTTTPRGAPPAVWHVKKGLQKTSDCALMQLNNTMSKGHPPTFSTFTHSVRIIEAGKVQEIIPQQIPSGDGELYVVRLTGEQGGTEVKLFSTLGLDKQVKSALSPCIGN
jgi:hypothetical protein